MVFILFKLLRESKFISFCLLLCFSSIQFVSAQYQGASFAKRGNGTYKNLIYWVNWDLDNNGRPGDDIANASVRTVNAPNGISYRITITKLSDPATTGLESYVPGQYGFDDMKTDYNWYKAVPTAGSTVQSWPGNRYNFLASPISDAYENETDAHNSVVGIANKTSGQLVRFRITVSASVGGTPISIPGMVIMGAESLGFGTNTEYEEFITNGAQWQAFDKVQNVVAGTSRATTFLSRANLPTPTTVRTYNPGSGGTTPTEGPGEMLWFSDGSTQIDVNLKGGGKQAVAVGFLSTSDYGDAPATFGSPAHILDASFNGGVPAGTTAVDLSALALATKQQPKLTIGNTVDEDPSPYYSANLLGDDNNTSDDEDGMSNPNDVNILASNSQTVSVYVRNQLTTAATLYGWIDANRNGTFEPNEAATPVIIGGNTTTNHNLTFNLASILMPYTNYPSRFRLAEALPVDNIATTVDERSTSDAYAGEVEDHMIRVSSNVRVTGKVNVDPNGNGMQDAGENLYSGTETLYAYLVDADNIVRSKVPVIDGQYTITDASLSPNNNVGLKVILSNGNLNVGTTLTTGTAPAGYIITADNTSNSAGNATTGTNAGDFVNNLIKTPPTGVTEVNFNLHQNPTANTASDGQQVNPGGTNAYAVPANQFGGSDADGGNIASIVIPTFPSGITSITIGGTTYTSNNWPSEGVTVATNASGVPTSAILIDPVDGNQIVVITYNTVDNLGAISTVPGSVTIPFVTLSISGTIFNDNDGGTPNGATAPGGLVVNLYDNDGDFVASVPVDTDGTYTVDGLISGDYQVQINTMAGQTGQNISANPVVLPANFQNVGSTDVAGSQFDGITPVTLDAASENGVDFGINMAPTAKTETATSQPNPGGTKSVVITNYFGGSDANNGVITTITITSFPANAASITIGNTSYTDLRALQTAFPNGIPTNAAGVPNTPISVDPIDGAVTVQIGYTTTDNAGLTSAAATVNIPFSDALISVSGTVWNDANGSATQDGSEPYTNGGGLFANLTDASGAVIVSVPVDPTTGAYNFANVAPNTPYNIVLTETIQTTGTVLTASDLSEGWVNTGVNLNGTESTANKTGIISVTTTTLDVTNLGFGIDQIPTADDKTISNIPTSTFQLTAPAGYTSLPGYGAVKMNNALLQPLSGSDPEDCATCGTGSTFVIESVQNNTRLYYDFGGQTGVQEVMAGTSTGTIPNYDPGKMVIYGAVGSGGSGDPFVFNYQLVDAAGVISAPATYSITLQSSLPVTLTTFTVKKGEGITARLDWVTVSESNSERFEIEHSTNAKNWVQIGTVSAKGESKDVVNYNFTHRNPGNGENLYRLKMVDLDGSFTYSRINSIRFSTTSFYPNPASDKIKINIEGADASNVATVKLLGLDGRVVYTASKLVDGEIDVRNITAGSYIVMITLKDGTTQNAKVVIVR